MKKIISLFISLFAICSLSNAQYLSDSTKYYLNIDDGNLVNALEICIKDIHEWNLKNYHKNGILNIYVSNNDRGCSMKVIHSYPQSSSIDIIPDYYSYIDGQIIFWYMGMSYLSTKINTDFKEFVSGIYSKFTTKSDKVIRPNSEETNIKSHDKKRDIYSIVETISAEDLKNAKTVKIEGPRTNLIAKPSTYVIEKTEDNGYISILEEKMIY